MSKNGFLVAPPSDQFFGRRGRRIDFSIIAGPTDATAAVSLRQLRGNYRQQFLSGGGLPFLLHLFSSTELFARSRLSVVLRVYMLIILLQLAPKLSMFYGSDPIPFSAAVFPPSPSPLYCLYRLSRCKKVNPSFPFCCLLFRPPLDFAEWPLTNLVREERGKRGGEEERKSLARRP